MGNGECDYLKLWLFMGVPFGICRMFFWIIPKLLLHCPGDSQRGLEYRSHEGNIRVIWKALVVPTGSSTQDIGSYYEEESGNSVSLSVDWLERARVKVVKVDSIANAKLSGTVFGIYRDKECTDLITKCLRQVRTVRQRRRLS